jgi:hypothetical protein
MRTMSHAGGFTFAEHPEREAPEARIIWRADLDPGTLRVVAVNARADDAPDDLFEARMLAPWLTIARAADGVEHAVISDGWHHIRLDVAGVSIESGEPVMLHYPASGLTSAERAIKPIRQFLHFCRHRRFAGALFPVDSRIDRELAKLRVHDAIAAGASHREIAIALFGAHRMADGWDGRSDSLRSRVRRLVCDARSMARGSYRSLLRKGW